MGKQSLHWHSDEELALMVANDEGLYNMRHTDELMEVINLMYEYIELQLAALDEYLEADLEETEDE